MSTQTISTRQNHTERVRRVGRWCVAAGLVGVLQAITVLVWPAQVSADRYSFPFTPVGHVVMQATLCVQHMVLAVALVTLCTLPPVRSSRVARAAWGAAAAAMAVLAVMEVVNAVLADDAADSAGAEVAGTGYGVLSILVGLGLVIGGVVAVRRPRTGWESAPRLPVVVLALGVYVFVPLTPAIMGPFVLRFAALAGWMLLFALLGLGLTRVTAPRGRASRST